MKAGGRDATVQHCYSVLGSASDSLTRDYEHAINRAKKTGALRFR